MRKARLNEKEKVFVEQMARTNDTSYASAKAGYKGEKVGFALLKKPMVQDALAAKKLGMDILCDAAPAVAEAHVNRLLGRGFPEPTHGEFAKLVAPYHKALAEKGIDLVDLDVDAMSVDQLRQAMPILQAELARIEGRIAEGATLVEAVERVELPDDVPEIDEDDDVFA